MKTAYEENAFRILGVAANATWKTVLDVQTKLKQRAKVGGLKAMADPLFFLNTIERNDSTIRDAFNRLDRPKTRLLERLFWFTESNPADSKAISQLGAGEFLESIEIWQSARFISARANLARLLQAVAVLKDPDANDISLWKNAFESWCIILENKSFWHQFENIEKDSGVEPLASVSEFEVLREESWEIILEPSISLLQEALERSQNEVAARHLDLIRHSGFPQRVISRVENQVFEPIEDRIEKAANSILQKLSEALESKQLSSDKKKDCDQAYRRYKSEVLPEVKRLVQLANVESEATKRARENAASCLRIISIRYHNEAEDLQSSGKLLREALAVSKDSFISERIKEDLVTISKNVQEERIQKYLKPIEDAANTILQALSEVLESKKSSSEKKKDCDQAYRRYKSEVLSRVERLAQIADIDSETIKRARETAASCLRIISIRYHNDVEDPQSSEHLLKEALALSKDSSIAERIKQDLATVSKNAQEQRVWKNIKPIDKAPTLYTINGIGTKLYGRTDHDPATDSYIATLYFVVLFIPIFPIRRYRIKDEGNNTYRFLGKATLCSFDKWHRGIALFLVGLFFVMSSLDSRPTSSVSPTAYTKLTNPTPYSIPETMPPNTTLDRTNTENYDLKAQIESAKTQLSIQEIELQKLSDKIDSYKSQIVSYAKKIQQIEDDHEAGYTVDSQDYENAIKRHNYYVELYNAELERYNSKYAEYKRLLDKTNAKVVEYNGRH